MAFLSLISPKTIFSLELPLTRWRGIFPHFRVLHASKSSHLPFQGGDDVKLQV